jgi:putative flippase GtrA
MPLKRLYDRLTEGQQQFLKFGIVGGVGFVVDAGTLWLMTRFVGIDRWTAGVISTFVFGMTTTWLLNRSFTFRQHRSDNVGAEYLRFASANIAGNLVSVGAYSLLTAVVPLFARLPVLAKAAGVLVGMTINFTGSKYFVFRRSRTGG